MQDHLVPGGFCAPGERRAGGRSGQHGEREWAAEGPDAREDALFDPDHKMLWYKMSVGSGGLLAQCFECMRVCPIATRSPAADPIRRRNAS